MPTPENESMGALGQVSGTSAPSKLGALSQNFYGNGPSLGESMGDVVKSLMPTQADKERSSSMAFWGGFGQPNHSGSLSGQLANATGAQSARELEGERLKASYVPMITQAMLAHQTQTLAANRAYTDLAEKAAPELYKAVASLGVNGGKPTRSQALDALVNTGKSLGLAPSMVQPHIENLPKDDAGMQAHIAQLGQRLNAGGFGNTIGQNAAGETTINNASKGAVGVAGSGTAQSSANPTTGEAKFKANTLGDPKEFSESLSAQAESATNLVRDLNEIGKNITNYTPGKYAEHIGNVVGSIKDIAGHIPGVNKELIEKLSSTLLAAPEGSKDSLAALQMTKQILSLNAMASARAAAGGRASIPEFNTAHASALATTSDPVTFAKLDKFARDNAERAVDRMEKFNTHLNDPNVKDKNILGFETKYRRDYLNGLNDTNKNDKATRISSETKKEEPKAEPAKSSGPASDLSLHEKGSEHNASGKAMVFENGRYRPAKLLKP